MDRSLHAYLQGDFEEAARRLAGVCLQPKDPRLRTRLRRWIFHGHPGLRHRAIQILEKLGDVQSIPRLAMRLARYYVDQEDIAIVLEAFQAVRPASVVALAELIRTGDAQERNVGITMLGLLGGDDLPVLIGALPAHPKRVSSALCGNKDPRVVSALVGYLENHSDLDVARALVECSGPSCVVAVIEVARVLLKARNRQVRDCLLEALGKIRDPAAVPVLRRFLTCHETIRTLAFIPGREALKALQHALTKKLPGETLDEVLCCILAHPGASPAQRRRAARIALSRLDLWGARLLIADLADCQPELELAARARDPQRRLALARTLSGPPAMSHYHYAITHGDTLVRRRPSSPGSSPSCPVIAAGREASSAGAGDAGPRHQPVGSSGRPGVPGANVGDQ